MKSYNARTMPTRRIIWLVAFITGIIPFAVVLPTSSGFQEAQVLRQCVAELAALLEVLPKEEALRRADAAV